jgi:hypothetical protein
MYFANIKFMRIIAIISFGLMLVGLGSILVGCDAPLSSETISNKDKDNMWNSHGQCVSTKIVEIEGHKYVIMVGFKCGGIIHAESCDCKK